MSKKKVIILTGGEHEFTVIAKEKRTKKTYKLKYSDSPFWTYPNQKILTAQDDGNGIKIEGKTYSYSELEHIRILLGAMETVDNNIFRKIQFNLIEEKKV